MALERVVIRFFGLAIHLRKRDVPQLPVEHRVVLLSNPPLLIEAPRGGIAVHQPKLEFVTPVPPSLNLRCTEIVINGEYRLKGVRMRIAKPINSRLLYEDTYDHIPHLVPLGSPLLPLNLDVVLHGAPPAAAYFDVELGTFHACYATVNGAIGTTLVVETENAPKLELACFGSEDWTEVDAGSYLRIKNMAEDGYDNDNDYMLNCEILDPPVPLPKPHPGTPDLPLCDEDVMFDFGPPCSNSNYP